MAPALFRPVRSASRKQRLAYQGLVTAPDTNLIYFWETEVDSISQNCKIIKNGKLQGCNSSAVLKTARYRCMKLIERKHYQERLFKAKGTPARLI